MEIYIQKTNSVKSSALTYLMPLDSPPRTSQDKRVSLFRPFPMLGIMTNDWSMYRPSAELNSRGAAAQQALLFNTDYADVPLKALHCAGCIVILSIVFPLSAPTWRASPSLLRPFTLAAVITGEYYHFFNRTAVWLNVFLSFLPRMMDSSASSVLQHGQH